MKNYLVLMVGLVVSISACEENHVDTNELLGVWQLTEVLADPGDGSGTFQPTGDNYKMTFIENGKLWMDQGLFCSPSLKLFSESNGTYDTSKNIIVSHECATTDYTPEYSYEINEHNELIVYLPCIEPCANKFVKIAELE